MSYPKNVMRILRQRNGLQSDDESMDVELNELTPREALGEIAGWKLGDTYWADVFIEWAEDCGLEVKEKESDL